MQPPKIPEFGPAPQYGARTPWPADAMVNNLTCTCSVGLCFHGTTTLTGLGVTYTTTT